MTDNHNYNEPTLGSTSGWGSQLNNNFSDLDTDVEIRDTDANKGNYTPKDGAKFVATDTGAIYIGNGTSWVLADIEADDIKSTSVETDKTLYDVLGSGSTEFFSRYQSGGNNRGGISGKTTTGVSTSATAIHSGGRGIAVIFGEDQNDVVNRFSETLVFHTFGGISSVIASATSGTPPSRSYSRDGADLDLAMGSGTYDVTVIMLEASDA